MRRTQRLIAQFSAATAVRWDLLGLPLILLVTLVFPHRAWGVYGLGVVTGGVYALNAIGVVLVYRSNRIINVAQLAVGGVGAVVFSALTTYDPLLRGVHTLCPTCLAPTPEWWPPAVFVLGGLLCVGISVTSSWLFYVGVVRYLDDAPRLVVTVATLFFVSVCEFLISSLSGARFWQSQQQRDAQIPLQVPRAPFSWVVRLGIVNLREPDLLVIFVVVPLVAGLAWYLRRSTAGVAIRAASENAPRVASLGVNVRSVTGRVWVVTGLVSGVAAGLSAMGGALPRSGSALNVELLVRVLLIAVFARFTSLGIAAVAAVVVGVLQQSVSFAYGSPVALDGALLGLIAVTLLLQRAQRVRADVDTASSMRTAREIRPIPAPLRRLPEVQKGLRTTGALGAVLLLGAPLVLSPRQTNVTSYAAILTLVFLSLLVLTGWAGQISLGQMAFAATGAYVAVLTGLPFPLSLLAGAGAGAALAAVTGIPGLRLQGLYLAIVTLALNLSVSTYLLNPNYLGSALPASFARPALLGMNLDNEQVFYYVVLTVVGVVVAMVAGMRRSTFARALIAARDNEPAAQVFGISLLRARLSAFAVSGGIAGLAGAMLAYAQHGVQADTFGATVSLQAFLFSVLGGLGAVAAPLVSGVLLAVARLSLNGSLVALATGVAGLGLLLTTNGGASEVIFGARDTWLRGVARRRRILVPSLLADERSDGRAARLPIRPKTRRGGATVFLPPRYRMDDQYAIRPPLDEPAKVAP